MGAAFPITSCGEAKVKKNFAAPKGARRISRLAAAELLCEKPPSGASLVGPGSAYSICLASLWARNRTVANPPIAVGNDLSCNVRFQAVDASAFMTGTGAGPPDWPASCHAARRPAIR